MRLSAAMEARTYAGIVPARKSCLGPRPDDSASGSAPAPVGVAERVATTPAAASAPQN